MTLSVTILFDPFHNMEEPLISRGESGVAENLAGGSNSDVVTR